VKWQTRTPASLASPASADAGREPAREAPRAAAEAPGRRAGADLSIGDVCARSGLSPRTVRYYAALGLLPGVRRRAGGRRVYGPDELERLHFIQRLKTLGLPLAEIRELNAVHAIGGSTAAMLARLDELLARRLAELDARIAELAGLREQIEKYRARVASRAGALRSRGGERR
jgi:DNA-binding transcriptional MerR regulator